MRRTHIASSLHKIRFHEELGQTLMKKTFLNNSDYLRNNSRLKKFLAHRRKGVNSSHARGDDAPCANALFRKEIIRRDKSSPQQLEETPRGF